MYEVPNEVFERVRALKDLYAVRDAETARTRAVLSGDWEKVAPGAFTDDYPAPMVANRIEVMNRDVSASLAPLPSINCAATNAMSDAAKKFAENRSRIANSYVRDSHLEAHHTDAASSYNAYGMLVYYVEPDFEAKMPRIRVRDGSAVYAVWDGAGRTVRAFEEFCVPAAVLADQFPGALPYLKREKLEGATPVTVVRYADRVRTVVYLPECGNHVVLSYASPVPGQCQYVCVPRPQGGNSFTGVPRGAYADLVFPQIADHEFRMLQLEAASKSVQAPLAVPPDVPDVPYGPDAVIRTQNPQSVRRVGMEIPQGAFAASELIRQDLAVGGMSPESRTGNIQASVITGKGIEAASAGYSSQIANAQIMIAFGLEQAIRLCFAMDEHLWGAVVKEIKGSQQGAPFTLKYRPSKDIKGDHTVDISYGFMSGMAPNNALVFILQAQAAGLISRDFAARQLPVGMNVTEEFHRIDLETLRNSLMQGLAALSQAIPGMVMQGQDPTNVIRGISEVAEGLKKGKNLEEIVAAVFAPEPPPAPAPGAEPAVSDTAGAPGAEPGGGGLTANLAAGGPNDRPDLQQFFAGLSSAGNPVLQGGVSTMDPVQGQ